jgi:hypothetical protein
VSGIITSILAAVSQRDFWSEEQIKSLVRENRPKTLQSLYGRAPPDMPANRADDLRAMQIFATDTQCTWLIADRWMAYCVLDDRGREEPRIQWRLGLEHIGPVQVDETWSETSGVLHFGDRPKGWLYSKDLFAHEPVQLAISRVLSGANS